MGEITFEMPLYLLAPLIILALVGLSYLSVRLWKYALLVHKLLKIDSGSTEYIDDLNKSDISTVDQAAQELLKKKISDAWYSFSSVELLNLSALRDDCHDLVKQIAGVYFPGSDSPEYEITVMQLLLLNERIAHRTRNMLEDLPTFNKVTVASIMEAKSILETTKKTIDKKGIRTGGRIAGRIWSAISIVNPNYWIRKVIFKGASEMATRKALTSVYRIAGYEAIRLYRASAMQTDPQGFSLEKELEANLEFEDENQQTHETSQQPEDVFDLKDKEGEMSDNQEWILPDEEEPIAEDQDKTQEKGHEKLDFSISKMLSNFVEGSMQLWDKMVNVDRVIESFQKKGDSVQCLTDIGSLPIARNDDIASAYISKGRWLSAAEGAATGLGGILLLSADAVSLLALQLRTIQQIGFCYGFDVSRPEEKLFAAKLLAESYSHPSGKERDALKKEMRTAAGLLKGKTPINLLQKRLFVQGFSKIAQKIGVRFGSRKAAQIVPIIGSAVGCLVNQKITKEIAETAKEVYRERFLQKQDASSNRNEC